MRTRAGRPVQQHALDMADAQALHHQGREHARRERAPEDGLELRVQAADAQALEVDLLVLEQLRRGAAALPLDGDARACGQPARTRRERVACGQLVWGSGYGAAARSPMWVPRLQASGALHACSVHV